MACDARRRRRGSAAAAVVSFALVLLVPLASGYHCLIPLASNVRAGCSTSAIQRSSSLVIRAATPEATEHTARAKGWRRAVSTDDGTVVTFVSPSSEDLAAAGLPVTLDRGALAVGAVVNNADRPALLALISPIPAFKGSSLATWTFGLQRLPVLQQQQQQHDNSRSSTSSSSSSDTAVAVEVTEAVHHALTHEAIARFLNAGARVAQLRGLSSDASFLLQHGFIACPVAAAAAAAHAANTAGASLPLLAESGAAAAVVLSSPLMSDSTSAATSAPVSTVAAVTAAAAVDEAAAAAASQQWSVCADRAAVMSAVTSAMTSAPHDPTLINIHARLLHDAGDIDSAVDAYMRAVQMDPSRGEIFRSLGGAYQSLGQHQMAFASLQQAISLDPLDYVAYLKLGTLYEQLATTAGKYEEAGGHAIKCYQYYLDGSHTEDTDVLTRLGNLQVRRLLPTDAVATYERALRVDSSLAPVWHNLASAHLKLRDTAAAATCLQKALELDPALPSARHLLASLGVVTGQSVLAAPGSDDESARAARCSHARDLYDFYADGYDDHMRKRLLYTAPRLLRAAARTAVNATFAALPAARRAQHGNDVLQYINGSLSLLDLGCGTGLCGSWMESYTSEAIGVDISQRMLDVATKKGCYTRLVRSDMEDYLTGSAPARHDLIVSGDALQYIGPLQRVFNQVARVLKPGGHFAITVPLLTDKALRRKAPLIADDDDTAAYTEPSDGSDSSSEGNSSSSEDELLAGEALSEGPVQRPAAAPAVTAAMLAEGYALQQEGTYSYTSDYVAERAAAAGLLTVQLTKTSTRIERGTPLPCLLCVFKRPLSSPAAAAPSAAAGAQTPRNRNKFGGKNAPGKGGKPPPVPPKKKTHHQARRGTS